MADHNTSIPGPAEFPATAWSQLLSGAPGKDSLEFLAANYWKPAYLYIRRRWRKGNEEAKDLTQGFFAEAIRTDLLSKANPERGSFRKFLRASLENFLRKAHRDGKALKRGGGEAVISLDAVGEVEGLVSREGDPEALFDREWLETVFQRCLPRLKDAYEKEGRGAWHELFRRYEIERPATGGPTYEDLAGEFRMTVGDVRNHLHHARGRWRKLVMEELRETTASQGDLEAELRELFAK